MTLPERVPSAAPPHRPDRLYRLLPAVHRRRDAEVGEPLRALLALIDDAVITPIETDIAALLDDAFIETCAPWVVPYLGDLLGVPPLRDHPGGGSTPRVYVANTIAYRRRKGTAAVAEQVARDVTGWPTRAVEQFQHLATNQHLDHVRATCRTTDLRDAEALERTGGPFEVVMRTVDVRALDRGRGRTNIGNLSLHRWRTGAAPLERVEARHVDDGSDPTVSGWRFLLDPLGHAAHAVNVPRGEEDIAALAEELDVPAPLRRRALHAELEQRRAVAAAGGAVAELRAIVRWFADVAGRRSAFVVEVDGRAVPPEQLHIAHLGTWRAAPAPSGGAGVAVALDPVLGRLVVRTDPAPAAGAGVPDVRVSWAAATAGDLGAGPYDRRAGVAQWRDAADPGAFAAVWQIAVARDPDARVGNPDPAQLVATLAEAVAQWRTQPARTDGTIVVLDSSTYVESLTGADELAVPAGSRLAIVAADWPLEPDPDAPGLLRRAPGMLDPTRRRPTLRGDVVVRGVAGASPDDPPGTCVLDGLAVDGSVTVASVGGPDVLGELLVAHTTLVPTRGGLTVEPGAARSVSARRAILGPLTVADTESVSLSESIVEAVRAPASTLDLDAVTVLGPVACRQLAASDTIFTEPVTVERRQAHEPDDRACVRYSYVAPGSVVPRRFRCQPDLAIDAVDRASGGPGTADPATVALAAARVVPAFVRRTFGDAGYGRLDPGGPPEIGRGGEDETEMGAFRFLYAPWRAVDGAVAVADFVRFGTVVGSVDEV